MFRPRKFPVGRTAEAPRKIFVLLASLFFVTLPACGTEERNRSSQNEDRTVEVLLEAEASAEVGRPDFDAAKFRTARHRMVAEQIAGRGVEDEAVLDAMRAVPRHRLVPDPLVGRAYSDRPLPIGHGQTISQPYIVALMTEKLGLGDDDRVLEVGTGSGYQAAILAEIVDEVVTVEIIDALAENAAADLEELGFTNITVLYGDGYFGYEEAAPYDAIIVTAAAEHIPPPLIAQLKPGGRMMIPVGASGWTQNLMLVEKDDDGTVTTQNILPVRFVPLTRQTR